MKKSRRQVVGVLAVCGALVGVYLLHARSDTVAVGHPATDVATLQATDVRVRSSTADARQHQRAIEAPVEIVVESDASSLARVELRFAADASDVRLHVYGTAGAQVIGDPYPLQGVEVTEGQTFSFTVRIQPAPAGGGFIAADVTANYGEHVEMSRVGSVRLDGGGTADPSGLVPTASHLPDSRGEVVVDSEGRLVHVLRPVQPDAR